MKINFFDKVINFFNKSHGVQIIKDDEVNKVVVQSAEKEIVEENFESKINKRGFLPINPEYIGASFVEMEILEREPRRFIIEECLEACQILWDKNIYTYMYSDFSDNRTWIMLKTEVLSEENMKIIRNLSLDDGIIKFNDREGTVLFGVYGHGKEAQANLVQIALQFAMQDVPINFAFITPEEALIKLGFTKNVPNPDYISDDELDKKLMTMSDIDEIYHFIETYYSSNCSPTKKVVDKEAIGDSINECFSKSPFVYDEEEERVYLSEYHYQKHLNYLKFLEQKNEVQLKR